ncbi:DUF1992 domain-containing protein [Aliiruegeria lutimaris]|uniref:DnaJ homologue subfamily C member 28 conserved domain-containing protein n=1 Tax=Aliiruegeria lutimaris TaxID=571298 RepID=A0A1G8Z3R7_9RHOB|nr:DUF1992 domain-containing protein [Aliiruegeria lutimaris]SDK09676.1 protein of unknown function [Aliiruegeria lutimaris]
MTDILNFLVNNAFREAEANGAFDNLPGAGKPLADLHQSKDAVVARIMKEANAKPAAVVVQKQIVESRARLKALSDPQERKAEMRRLADLQTRLAIEQEAWRKHG